jgi:hypothetical protein
MVYSTIIVKKAWKILIPIFLYILSLFFTPFSISFLHHPLRQSKRNFVHATFRMFEWVKCARVFLLLYVSNDPQGIKIGFFWKALHWFFYVIWKIFHFFRNYFLNSLLIVFYLSFKAYSFMRNNALKMRRITI